jgi:hypothetical protein
MVEYEDNGNIQANNQQIEEDDKSLIKLFPDRAI